MGASGETAGPKTGKVRGAEDELTQPGGRLHTPHAEVIRLRRPFSGFLKVGDGVENLRLAEERGPCLSAPAARVGISH